MRRLIFGALLVALAGLIIIALPDLQRYLEIRAM